MKITKISAGYYDAGNGFTIKKNGCKGWYIYKDGLRYAYRCTLKEAKEMFK